MENVFLCIPLNLIFIIWVYIVKLCLGINNTGKFLPRLMNRWIFNAGSHGGGVVDTRGHWRGVMTMHNLAEETV